MSIAEEVRKEIGQTPEIDLINAIVTAQSVGWIDKDFYVKDCISLLKYFTGKSWTRRKVDKLPAVIKNNEYTECNWYNPATKKEHFTRRSINTLENSITVNNGYIRYYYIYEWKD